MVARGHREPYAEWLEGLEARPDREVTTRVECAE